MLGRVVPLDFCREAAGFLGPEGRIQRRRRMRVEIIDYQANKLGIGKMLIDQCLDLVREVLGRMLRSDIQMTPPSERLKEAEQVAGAAPFILIVNASGPARSAREWSTSMVLQLKG